MEHLPQNDILQKNPNFGKKSNFLKNGVVATQKSVPGGSYVLGSKIGRSEMVARLKIERAVIIKIKNWKVVRK